MKAKTHIALWGAVAAVTLAAAAPAVGQSATGATNPNSLGQVAKVNQVYGNEVISSDNQKVGKLNNLVIDLESGRILYGVVGASNGRVAVAPEIFTATPTSDNQDLHVNVTKAKIDGAPKFNSNVDQPNQMDQASFVDQVYQYFGQPAWWQGGSTPANQGAFHNVHKASKVLGMKVEDVNNQTIGKINNVMVDLPAGRIAYVIFEPASSLNLGDNLYALPPQAVTAGQNNQLGTGLTRDKLANAPHFTSNSWPNLSDPTFASQVYQYYGKQAWFNNANTPQPTGR